MAEGTVRKVILWRWRNVRPRALLSLHACSHGYIHPRRRSLRSQQWTHHIQNHSDPFPRSHSWGIVCPWRPTISCFSHVRQLIPLSPRLLDSALGVWIWRRAGAGGTMPCSCPSSAHQAWSWIENSAHGHSFETTRLFQLAGQPKL